METAVVRDVMSAPVVTIGIDETIARARDLFDEHRFHHLPVVQGGLVVGILSDRDVLFALSPFVGKLAERRQDVATVEVHAHTIMTRNILTIGPEADLATAIRALLARGLSCLPVVDDQQRLVGIVSWRDLLGRYMRGEAEASPFAATVPVPGRRRAAAVVRVVTGRGR